MVNLETTEVVLAYGSKRVVDGLDFVVPEGKITVIIGPNGSGKSTCLRGLARVLRPASGVVLLNGRDIHDQSTKVVAKQIGILPQGPTVPAFEKALATKVDASYAVAVNSATSALHIACLALGLVPGDRLWTSPISFVASANCGRICGAASTSREKRR